MNDLLNADYVRNLNCNYERIALEKIPEEKKYQYGILNRGGIRYVLPCSLRYINGIAYLYYDITSLQNVEQLYSSKPINREWIKNFLWSMQQVKLELGRYLLDERCIIWQPKHIYQDLDKLLFHYLYVPYYDGENGMDQLFDFWIDHIDYQDEELVGFVYRACEQYKRIGAEYLQKKLFEDFHGINEVKKEKEINQAISTNTFQEDSQYYEKEAISNNAFRLLWDSKRKREERKAMYRMQIRQQMEGLAVCEDQSYPEHSSSSVQVNENYGKTIYIEEPDRQQKVGLYRLNGELLTEFTRYPFIVGKKKEDVDYALSDASVSRMHARFVELDDGIYVEDVNSTNGTYKNGVRLMPYERRKLEDEDELRFGTFECVFKSKKA